MSINISKQQRERMINFLSELKNKFSDDESSIALNEIENALVEKKFGLIWEEHSEKVDLELETKIPVFSEVEENEITSNEGSYNFLLEGDNLHSLYLLEKTHKEKIDLILIDPPYNTGNKDFMFNDKFIDKEDSWRHSKWISFMHKRLFRARNLLKDSGIIFIHIDEIEFSQLKLLCDEVFGENNFLGTFIWRARSGKGGTDDMIAHQHEYIFCYAKNKSKAKLKADVRIGKERVENFRQWGQEVYREDRPTMFFPILYNPNNGDLSLVPEKECKSLYDSKSQSFNDEYLLKLKNIYENKGWKVVLPMYENEYGRWRVGWKTAKKLIEKRRVFIEKKGDEYIARRRYEAGNVTETAVSSLILDKGTASTGTNEIKEIFKQKVFDTTKPLDVTKFLIDLALFDKKDAIVLDFFAGSGTTGQAVIELNKEDEGNRKFILCTNNEGGICTDVTYPRIKNVINGYEFTGKKETILYEKRFNQSHLRNMDKQWKEINKIKKENELKYDRVRTSFTEGTFYIYGVKEYDGKTEKHDVNLLHYKTDYIQKYNEFDDMYISDELMKHIKEMVQLEHHINVNSKEFLILYNDDDLINITKSQNTLDVCKKIFKPSFVFLDSKQKQMLNKNGIEIVTIPDYYFANELRSVGEL